MALEADLMLPVDPMTRVAAALADQEAASALARRLKLSNEERDRLVAALGDDVKITSLHVAARNAPRAFTGSATRRSAIASCWPGPAAGGDEGAAMARARSRTRKMWKPPKLPLTGDEVMAAGVPAGPKVGVVMREVEDWWIDADFPDDKLSVIERLKAVAQGLS